MSGLENWFAVFRAGTHTAQNGKTVTFTDADLDEIVARYSPVNPSPCVITHDELFSPFAYAKVDAVKNDGGVLMAKCDAKSIEPQFAELVKNGRLFNRSVQLLPAKTGGWRLGHVAFLGAEPPAVEGLAPIEMSTAGMVFSAEDAWEKVDAAHAAAAIWAVLKKLADKIFGADADDNPVSEYQLNAVQQRLGAARREAETQPDGGKTMSEFTQEQLDAAVKAAVDQATAAADKKFAAERAEFSAERKKTRGDAIAARVEKLVDSGQITPAQRAGLVEFALAIGDAEAIEFTRPAAEGGKPSTEKTSAEEFFFNLLGSLPVQIELGKKVGDQPVGDGGAVDLNNPNSIIAGARQFQKSQAELGVTVTSAAAIRHVTDAATNNA